MCVALLKLPGARLSNALLEDCWDSNPDGGGYSFSNQNEMVTAKGLMTIEEFIDSYRKEEDKDSDRAAMLHFRIATSGLTDAANTHPFEVDGGRGVMCHNGIMQEFEPSHYKDREGMSDTANFCRDFGEDFSADVVRKIKDTLQYQIGWGNKLVFLYPKGDYTIVNEKAGEWIKGTWFSNLYWKGRRYV